MTACPLTGKYSDNLYLCDAPYMPEHITVCELCPAFDPTIYNLFPETKTISVDEFNSMIEEEIKKIEGVLE